MNSISSERYGSMLNAKKISVARVKIWRSAKPNPYQPAIDQKIAFSPEQRNQISDGRVQFERHKLNPSVNDPLMLRSPASKRRE